MLDANKRIWKWKAFIHDLLEMWEYFFTYLWYNMSKFKFISYFSFVVIQNSDVGT